MGNSQFWLDLPFSVVAYTAQMIRLQHQKLFQRCTHVQNMTCCCLYAVVSMCNRLLDKLWLYVQEDWIGLRELDKRGAVRLQECKGNHMQISEAYFQKQIIDRYLTSP